MVLCISLNNQAMEFLRRRDFEPAIVKLRYALALISNENNPHSDCWDTEATGGLLPSPVAVELDRRMFSRCLESSPDNLFTVYEKGFVFQHSESKNSLCHSHHQAYHKRMMMVNPLVRSKIVRSVVMYNLALATHGLGLISGNNSPLCFHRALHLYQISLATLFESIGELQQQQPQQEEKPFFLVLLALLANMGHLMSHFWMFQGAMDCLRSMENYRSLPLYNTLPTKETKFFNQTVVFARVASTRFSVAPAA